MYNVPFFLYFSIKVSLCPVPVTLQVDDVCVMYASNNYRPSTSLRQSIRKAKICCRNYTCAFVTHASDTVYRINKTDIQITA
jgi:hypothetical protein